MQKFIISIGFLIAVLGGSGCTYKMDIQQGNLTSEERLAKLELGMNPRQVQFIMGSPILLDPFHADRWDYYYSLRQQGEEVKRYRVTLFFEGAQLKEIEREGPIPESDHAQPSTTE